LKQPTPLQRRLAYAVFHTALIALIACGGAADSDEASVTLASVESISPAILEQPVKPDAARGTTGGRAAAIPVGIENVNDSPLKRADYRTLLRFVPEHAITIDRFYFGFKLLGARCNPGTSEYGRGDGGTLLGQLVEIDQDTGLPGKVITSESVNACTRFTQASTEFNGATPVLVWLNTAASLDADTMYAVIISNAHPDPANNFFSFNMPLADTQLAGPHARNELDARAGGAIMALDPREHVAWSEDAGATWQYGSANGQYRSYMNDNDTAHPATRMPQYGFRLKDGATLGPQPYYAYGAECSACTTAYANARVARTYTQVGGFTAASASVGTLVMTNTDTGENASCVPEPGYGFRTCDLATPVTVAAGQGYTVRSTGTVELMKMDWSQRQLFPDVGSVHGNLRAYQPSPAAGTNMQDVPSLWAGPVSGYVERWLRCSS
jgi:hypothetical protein